MVLPVDALEPAGGDCDMTVPDGTAVDEWFVTETSKPAAERALLADDSVWPTTEGIVEPPPLPVCVVQRAGIASWANQRRTTVSSGQYGPAFKPETVQIRTETLRSLSGTSPGPLWSMQYLLGSVPLMKGSLLVFGQYFVAFMPLSSHTSTHLIPVSGMVNRLGGTPVRASRIKRDHISAGKVPPETRMPWTLFIDI